MNGFGVLAVLCTAVLTDTPLCPLVLKPTATKQLLVYVLASDALGKEDPSVNAIAVCLLQ